MNIREKIARGMASADGFDPDYEMKGPRRIPSGVPFFKHPMYQKYTDAALDALMDATPEMIRALKPGMDYEEAFQAMIRAAKEGK